MKRFILFLLAIVLPLAFSSCKDEPTVPTKEEVVLESITCVDKDFNEVDRITYYIHQTEYIYQDVYVYAIYSDGSKGDVTAFVSFSNINLEKAGEKEVLVTYKGLSDKIIVEVLKSELSRIEINSKECKKVYAINDEIDLSNLKVIAFYENGKRVEVEEYECFIYDEEGFLYKNDKFTKKGTYKVVVKYDNQFDEYYIYVYPTYSLIINVVSEVLDLDVNGEYIYTANEIIAQGKDYKFSSSGNIKLATENISTTVFDNEFKYSIDIDSENGIVLDVDHSFEMMLVFDGDDNNPIYVSDINNTIVDFYYEYAVDKTFVFLKGNSNIYNIYAVSRAKILGICINIIEDKTINELVLETQNVKTIFKQDDKFNYSGLIVKGKVSYNEYVNIDLEDCDIYLTKNGDVVDSFTVPGVYEVQVHYRNNGKEFVEKYSINVEKTITQFIFIELDIQNVKTEFGTNEVFNYDYLVVYGYVDAEEMIRLNETEYTVSLYFTDGYNTAKVSSFSQVPGQYFVEVSYNNIDSVLTKSYDINYDLGILEYSDTPEIVVNFNDNIVSVEVENVLTALSNIKFKIYDENNVLVLTFSNLNFNISNLDKAKSYTLVGYYTGVINGQKYIVYIEDTIINFQ